MATEVMNSPGAGVNLSQVNAAEIDPTVGSVRRTGVSGFDLSGINAAVSAFQRNRATSNARAQKEADNRVLSQAADTDLAIEEAFLTDAPSAEIVRIATGYQEDTGEPLSPEAASKLSAFNDYAKRLDTARAQGNSGTAMGLAKVIARRRLLAEHPELGPETLEISGKVATLQKDGFEASTREERAAYEAKTAAKKAQRDLVLAAHVPGVNPTSSDDDIQAAYDQYLAPMLQATASHKRRYDATKARADATQAMRDEAKKELVHNQRPTVSWGINTSINAILLQTPPEGENPDAWRQAQLREAKAKQISHLQQQYDLNDPAEVQREFGTSLMRYDDAITSVGNPEKLSTLKRDLDIETTQAQLGFTRKYPDALELGFITKNLGDIVGDAAIAASFVVPVNNVINRLSENMMASAGGYPLPGVYPTPSEMAKPGVARQAEKDNAAVIDGLMKNYTKASPEQQRASGAFVNQVLRDPYTAKSATAWDALLPTLANPEFRQYAKAAGIDVNDPVIVQNTRSYIRALGRDARTGLSDLPEGVNLSLDLEKGLVPENVGAIADSKRRDGLLRAIERINYVLDAGVNTMGYPDRARAYSALVVPSLMGQN